MAVIFIFLLVNAEPSQGARGNGCAAHIGGFFPTFPVISGYFLTSAEKKFSARVSVEKLTEAFRVVGAKAGGR